MSVWTWTFPTTRFLMAEDNRNGGNVRVICPKMPGKQNSRHYSIQQLGLPQQLKAHAHIRDHATVQVHQAIQAANHSA